MELFVKTALRLDPVKVDLNELTTFGEIDPKKIINPTLLIQGQYDAYSSTQINAKLFTRLATWDRQWAVVPGGDHAAHLENTKDVFSSTIVNFLKRVVPSRDLKEK